MFRPVPENPIDKLFHDLHPTMQKAFARVENVSIDTLIKRAGITRENISQAELIKALKLRGIEASVKDLHLVYRLAQLVQPHEHGMENRGGLGLF